MNDDAYSALGLRPEAELDDVKAAYRRLAMASHPDRTGNDPVAAVRFGEITRAYETILNAPARVRVRAPRRGEDRSVCVAISVVEAIYGATRSIELSPGRSTLARLPMGMADGDVVRLMDMGEDGRDGGPNGDMLVTVMVEAHPDFTLDGRNVRIELLVEAASLALGGPLTAPTPRGEIIVTAPANSRDGRVLRLRGKGLPGRAGAPVGDLHIVLRERPPKALAEAAADFAARWSPRTAA